MNVLTSPQSYYPILDGADLRFVETADNKKIRYAIWKNGHNGLIIFLNGRNEYIEKYNEAYLKFQKLGFAVVSLDWRGQGLSEKFQSLEKLGHIETFSEYQSDLDATLDEPSVKSIKGPRFMVAHSTGGCIGLRNLTKNNFNIERAVFLAPLWGGSMRQRLSVSVATLMVKLGFGDISLNSLEKNPDILRSTARKNCHTSDTIQFSRLQDIIKTDPRLLTGPPSFRWLSAVYEELNELSKLPILNIPHMVLLGENDTLISKKAIEPRCRNNPACEFHILKKARHELLIEKQETIDIVWKKIKNFLL